MIEYMVIDGFILGALPHTMCVCAIPISSIQIKDIAATKREKKRNVFDSLIKVSVTCQLI